LAKPNYAPVSNISVNYMERKEHEGPNSSNHIIYIIIVKCNIIVSEIRG